ncbi:unnamed protein product, partial [Coccothraustes coccothraustes]
RTSAKLPAQAQALSFWSRLRNPCGSSFPAPKGRSPRGAIPSPAQSQPQGSGREGSSMRPFQPSPEGCSLCPQAGTRWHSGTLLPALSPAGLGAGPQALGWGWPGPKQAQGRPG